MSENLVVSDYYLLNMAGDGDVILRLVDQETWDWIGSQEKTVPVGIVTREADWRKSMNQSPDLRNPTMHHNWNDRALAVPPCQHSDGTWMDFGSLRRYIEFLKSHPNVHVLEEYNGMIY